MLNEHSGAVRVRAATRLFRRNERQAEPWKAGEVEKYQAGRYDKTMKEKTAPEKKTNSYGNCIVTTPEKDYIAVYDKKMLWRAIR